MAKGQTVDYKIVIISLCIVHVLTLCEGRPLRKRTVSEVQLMHNLGEHRQVQERRDWLQMRLRGIHSPLGRSSGEAGRSSGEAGRSSGETGRSSGETGRLRRKLRPEELSDLSDLSPEEIQFALNFLEKLLKSKHS